MRVAALTAILTCATSCHGVGPDGFGSQTFPFHPAVVLALTRSLDVPAPTVVAVDLAAYDDWDVPYVERDGSLRVEGDDGFYEYTYLGSSTTGTHVVLTARNTGGTTVFETVLLLRVESDIVLEDGRSRSRRTLRRIGSFMLGERDGGRVELRGNALFIGRGLYRGQDLVIPLE